MLVNKLFVLDHGYVAFLQSSFDSVSVAGIRDSFMGADPIHDKDLIAKFGRLSIVMHCPIFVMCGLTKYNFDVMNTVTTEALVTYCPNPGEIESGEHEIDIAIADDISRTTQALLINPQAYQSDGCNRFISQLVTPISAYTTLIISGSYNEWQRYVNALNVPKPIAAYQLTIKQLIDNEWKSYG